ncbi:MAG: hypothetical protein M1818_004590 [Claussenomyces sp. TS43310]|nr:MAG: hypothetical protein M1818_004590 [Claussenomyces sp. TS43310]
MTTGLHGNGEATETSPLLAAGITKSIDASSGFEAGKTTQTGAVNGANGAEDTENGGAEEVNPLHKGLPEVYKQLHWLLPAVGIGNARGLTPALSYFLTLTAFQPLYGKLSDIFGRKPALLFGYTVFGLGCLFCGLARNIQELIAARAFAGIGGGGMTTVVSIMMSDIIPLRSRGTWQGYVNIIFAAGAASGAPLGGIFADSIGWRWSFLGQAPICAIAFLAVYYILELPAIEHSHWKEKLARIDFLGAFCLVAAIFVLLLGLDHGSNVAWNSTLTIVCLALSLPLLALFILVEMRFASNPFAPGHVILERSLTAAYVCNFFAFGSYMSTLFYVPLYFQAVDGLSATQAGVRLIPSIVFSVTGSVVGGVIMQKTGKYYWLTIVAYCCLVCGHIPILICSGLVVNATVGIIAGLCLTAFGGGVGVTSSLIALISNADPRDQAIATACSYLFRSLGSVVGLSLTATVVQQALRNQLIARLDSGPEADHIIERVRQSLDYIKELEPHTRLLVVECYQRAISAAFVLSIVLASGAVIGACFIRERPLGK